MEKRVLCVVVNNSLNVLNRVAGLFSKRGCSIHSFSMRRTDNPKLCKMTISLNGDDYILQQLIKQLNKLQEVILVQELKTENSE